MTAQAKHRVLVVSPAFHGYWAAMAAALEALGHEVVAHCYDTGGGLVADARNALAHRLPGCGLRAGVQSRITERAVAALRDSRPSAVLVVKGDRLGDAWWEALQDSGARVVVWLYDELSRMSYRLDRLRDLGSTVSYSRRDVASLRDAGVEAGFLPDGFDSLTSFTPHPSPAVTFVGARYPERERVLRQVASRGLPVAAYGREWSRHPWDVVRTGKYRGSGLAAHRDLSRTDYYGVMAGGLATLNIHGQGHDGLSMRTFEAPGVGALSLVDRPDVAEHYDIGSETLVFTSDDELVEHLARAQREPAWATSVREAGRRRTLAEHTLVHRMAEVARRWA
ncbi:CgeB family protein [Monashia sp. NPDC004114]